MLTLVIVRTSERGLSVMYMFLDMYGLLWFDNAVDCIGWEKDEKPDGGIGSAEQDYLEKSRYDIIRLFSV